MGAPRCPVVGAATHRDRVGVVAAVEREIRIPEHSRWTGRYRRVARRLIRTRRRVVRAHETGKEPRRPARAAARRAEDAPRSVITILRRLVEAIVVDAR